MSNKKVKKEAKKYHIRQARGWRSFPYSLNSSKPDSDIVLRVDFVPMLQSEGYKAEVITNGGSKMLKINGYDFYINFNEESININTGDYGNSANTGRYFKMDHNHTSKGIKSKIDHLLSIEKKNKENKDEIDKAKEIAEKLQKEFGSMVSVDYTFDGNINIDLSGTEIGEYDIERGKREGISILINRKTFEIISLKVHEQNMNFDEYPEYMKNMMAMYLKAETILRNLQKSIKK